MVASNMQPLTDWGCTGMTEYLTGREDDAIPLSILAPAEFERWVAKQPRRNRTWLESLDFKAKPGSLARIPDTKLGVAHVVVGADDPEALWTYGDLAAKLGQGSYRLTRKLSAEAATRAAIGWGLGTYVFDRYRTKPKAFASLVWPDGADRDHVIRSIEGVFLARDLINTPANDLGPAELEDAARSLAKRHKAKVNVVVGDELLKQNYPTIH